MRYFAYMAEQCFRDSPEGTRLFCGSGVFTRPYVIPDAETERRLFRKLLWIFRSLLGLMIVGQPFLFLSFPSVVVEPVWFLTYLGLVLLIWSVVLRLVLHKDLAKLDRAASRMPLRTFFAGAARGHRTYSVVLGFIASLMVVVGSLWVLSKGDYIFVPVFCVAFFGLCALAWGYALAIKVAGRKPGTEVLRDEGVDRD